MSKHQKITYVYDDKTENLLDQYSQQLAVYDTIFAIEHKDLSQHDYACARDNDQVLSCILEVIARIYEQAIPIAIIVGTPAVAPTIQDPGKGGAH